jgi:hypothetical protein
MSVNSKITLDIIYILCRIKARCEGNICSFAGNILSFVELARIRTLKGPSGVKKGWKRKENKARRRDGGGRSRAKKSGLFKRRKHAIFGGYNGIGFAVAAVINRWSDRWGSTGTSCEMHIRGPEVLEDPELAIEQHGLMGTSPWIVCARLGRM